MKRFFQNRSAGFWLCIAAAAIGLIGSVLYLVLDGADRTFSLPGFVLALCGVLSVALTLVPRLSVGSFVSAALYAAAFGVVLRVAVPSLSDVWNHVNFIGGNAAMGMSFSGVYFLCAGLCCAACFLGTERAA